MNKSEKAALQPPIKVKTLHAQVSKMEAEATAGSEFEKAPDQNEVNFRSLIENVQDVVARYNLDLRYMYISPSIERYMDVKSEGLIGKTHRDAGFSKSLSNFFDHSLRHVIASKRPLDVEFAAKSRGVQRFLESRAYPEFDENGNVKSIVTVTRDITERKQAEQALRESDERFKSIYTQSPVGIEIYDAAGKMLDINPAGMEIFGIERAELVRGFDLFADPNITRKLRKKLAEGKPIAFESVFDFELVKKKGLYPTSRSGQCYIECFITPLSSSGKSVSGYVVHVREITERQKIAQALAKREERFRALIEHSADAISLIDAHGAVVYESPSTQRLTGYSFEERMGRSGLELIYPDDLPAVKSALAEVISNKGMIKNAQFRSVRKGGTVWWAEATAVNLLDEPSVQAIVINYRDITQRKKTEQALKNANRQLNVRLAQIEQLQSELREQALRDPLTQLFNRRYLSETMERELKLAKREKKPVSVIVMDIDRFKKINDKHGHRVGDEFLTEIAKLLQSHARGSDIICRYGGEEFLIVMPGANARTARKRAEQLRVRCEKMRIAQNGKELKVTLSFGVATYPTHGTEGEEIVIKADKALYKSKRRGRNCVTVWSEKSNK